MLISNRHVRSRDQTRQPNRGLPDSDDSPEPIRVSLRNELSLGTTVMLEPEQSRAGLQTRPADAGSLRTRSLGSFADDDHRSGQDLRSRSEVAILRWKRFNGILRGREQRSGRRGSPGRSRTHGKVSARLSLGAAPCRGACRNQPDCGRAAWATRLRVPRLTR